MDARPPHAGVPSAAAFRRLAWTAAACTLVLVTLGGVVRITGSGMGCGDDWPLCHGRLIPPLDLPTLIEYGHRLVASVLSLLVLGLLVLAWIRHRASHRLRDPATLAAVLLAAQVLLGAVAVWLRLPAGTVVLHFATAMVLLAVLVMAALRAGESAGGEPGPDGGRARGAAGARRWGTPAAEGGDLGLSRSCAGLARSAAGLGFVTVVLGGVVANLRAGPACHGFPLCNGVLLPAGELPAVVHWSHRLAAFTLLALLVALVALARRGAVPPRVRRLATSALAVGGLQLGIAAAMVQGSLPAGLRVAHLTAGALLWAVLVALVHAVSVARRPSAAVARPLILAPIPARMTGGSPAGAWDPRFTARRRARGAAGRS